MLVTPPGSKILPLRAEHLPALATALRHPAVYEHLGGTVPTEPEFLGWLTRALAGPPPERPAQRWLNFLMSDSQSDGAIGLLQATMVPGGAEVAFLLAPSFWGRGLGRGGLDWLHAELRRVAGDIELWATTVPANRRCRALLASCGYRPVEPGAAPPLASYDPGDLVFRRAAP